MSPGHLGPLLRRLETGPLTQLSDWPDLTLPKGPPGAYTLWNDANVFLYVGVSYKDANDAPTNPQAAGVWGRLNHHARVGGASHLRTYLAERFVIPDLTRQEREELRRGTAHLGEKVTQYISEKVAYRVVICEGPDARLLESTIRRYGLPHVGRPLLNPTTFPG